MSIGVATACAILRDATIRLDAIRLVAEREILEHLRSREQIEGLIERLIAGLDEVDALDDDIEGGDEIDILDLGEHVEVAHARIGFDHAYGMLARRRAAPLVSVLAMASDGRAHP